MNMDDLRGHLFVETLKIRLVGSHFGTRKWSSPYWQISRRALWNRLAALFLAPSLPASTIRRRGIQHLAALRKTGQFSQSSKTEIELMGTLVDRMWYQWYPINQFVQHHSQRQILQMCATFCPGWRHDPSNRRSGTASRPWDGDAKAGAELSNWGTRAVGDGRWENPKMGGSKGWENWEFGNYSRDLPSRRSLDSIFSLFQWRVRWDLVPSGMNG